jgi:spermidine/putrescine transport system permease protein
MDIAVSKNGRRSLATFFLLLVAFIYLPLVMIVVFSFNDSNIPAFPLEGFTLHGYEQFASNPELKGSLVTSAKVAAVSSTGSVVLGMLATIALIRRRFFGKPAVSALLLSPLVIPYIAFAIALLILLKQIPVLDPGFWAVVIGHVVVALPFMILVLAPRLERIDARLEEAAQDLGAGSFRTFRSITLPLILPAVVSAFLIAFVSSFDEIIIASFVAGDVVTFPLYLFSQLRFPQLLPQILAVATIVFISSLFVILLTEIGRRVAERRLAVEVEGG